MKKMIQVVVALVVSICFIGSADAAVNQKLMDYAKGKVSAADLVRVERFLTSNEVNDTEAERIIVKAEQIEKIVKDAGVTDYTKLGKAQKEEVMKLAEEAAAIIDAKITYDASNKTVLVTDAQGVTYDVPVEPYLKTTGSSNAIYVASISGVAIIGVAGAALYRKKKNA